VEAVFDSCVRSTADVREILQTVSPTEIIPTLYHEVAECIHFLPAVIEWMQ
jgi:hypothetical protein